MARSAVIVFGPSGPPYYYTPQTVSFVCISFETNVHSLSQGATLPNEMHKRGSENVNCRLLYLEATHRRGVKCNLMRFAETRNTQTFSHDIKALQPVLGEVCTSLRRVCRGCNHLRFRPSESSPLLSRLFFLFWSIFPPKSKWSYCLGEGDGWRASSHGGQRLCDLAWEMDLPSVQRGEVEFFGFFFLLMTCSSRRWNLSHQGSAGARSDFHRLNGPQCSVGYKGFVWVSNSIESLSGTHASPLRERCSSPSLLARVGSTRALLSPPPQMLFAAAQEFSSVIARMRCSRQELSWGKVDFWIEQSASRGEQMQPLCTSHYYYFFFKSYFISFVLNERMKHGPTHLVLGWVLVRFPFQT